MGVTDKILTLILLLTIAIGNLMEHKSSSQQVSFQKNEGKLIKNIKGYASIFNNIDSHGDIIIKGAFLKTIEDYKNRKINLYSSHSMDARELIGSIVELREDNHGLYFEANVSSAPSAQDIAIKAQEGHLDEVSIGFMIKDFEHIRNEETGQLIRVIKEIDLVEISLVSRASNPEAKLLEVKQEQKSVESEVSELQTINSLENNNESKKEMEMSEEKKNNIESLEKKMQEKIDQLEALLSQPVNKLPAEVEEKAAPKELDLEITSEVEMEMFEKAIRSRSAEMEYKALSSSVDADGGLACPAMLLDKILEKRDQLNKLENLLSVENVNGAVNLLDFDFSESLSAHEEGAAVSIDDIVNAFGKSILDPQDFSIIVKVSRRFERRALMNVQNFLARRYAVKYRNQLENHVIQGTGVQQPLGIATFMDDVNSANQITSVTGGTIVGNLVVGDLIDLEMTLAEEYRQNAVFLASPTAIKELKKLEDTNGSRVWQRNLEAGKPATLLGYPIIEIASGSIEAGTSAGHQPVFFCDPSMYMLAKEADFSLEILREAYAANDQIGLKFHVAYDGMPIDKSAFASINIQA